MSGTARAFSLTAEGVKLREIIQPLLSLKEETFARIREELQPAGKTFRLGLTTAFEQGVFARLEAALPELYGTRSRILRASSPKLAREVRRGNLDAALVALPLDAAGLAVREIAHQEPLLAAIPEAWRLDRQKPLLLASLSGRPLFWFKRETNPAFFDFCKGRFAVAGFEPLFLEEPAEHDVLLARIAAGEGMGLLAASFAAIRRRGVVFLELSGQADLYVKAGLIARQERPDLVETLAGYFST